MYGRSSKRIQVRNSKNSSQGDHGYAGARRQPRDDSVTTSADHVYEKKVKIQIDEDSRPETRIRDHQYAGSSSARKTMIETSYTLTPPGSRVHSEHSYGTKRDSSPEHEHNDQQHEGDHHEHSHQQHGGDHLYSADKEETETDDNDEELVARGDHPYFSSPERKSPRFRKIIPKSPPPTITSPSNPFIKKIPQFICSTCGKSFPQAYRLKRHIREVHNQEKTFNCNHCGKKFFKAGSLKRHVESVHEKKRPLSCQHCQSKFKDSTALSYHVKKNVCKK